MQSIIVTTLYLLTSLIPLTFTTINFELFEFPKFILLLSGTLVIMVSWALHIYQTRDYSVLRGETPKYIKMIHWSILSVLATQTLATIFSIHPYTSFWGYYSRFHGGLLTTICYTVIYFAAVKWLDTKSTQKLMKISIITSILIGLYAILEHFGIDKNYWIQDVQNRVFSTLGQPNWLAAYLIPNIFLVLYLSQINQKSTPILYTLYFILYTALLFTKSRSGLLAFGFAYLTYWLLLIRQFTFTKLRSSFIPYTVYSILLVALIGTPYTPSLPSHLTKAAPVSSTQNQGTALESGGTESGDIRKIVWTGALRLIAKHPLLGTGPETFAYTYYWERPLSHNLTSEWDFLYNKAHNEYLNIAAGSGLLGLLAYLAWHGGLFATSLTLLPRTKKINQNSDIHLRSLYPVLGACVVGFTLTNFFGFSVIPVYLMMILISGLPTALQNPPSSPSSQPLTIYYVLCAIVLIYPLRLFLADYNYAQGKRNQDEGHFASALPYLTKAVNLRPGIDLYHATLGETYATLGQTDKALAEASLNSRLNPYHLNYYKSRAKIYLSLTSLDPSYHRQASEELIQARRLAPSDPKLAYNLGLVYTRLDQIDLAEQQLLEAIHLKPNYGDAYYALTLLYEQNKRTALIPPLLQDARSHLATYSSQLKEKIEKYLP